LRESADLFSFFASSATLDTDNTDSRATDSFWSHWSDSANRKRHVAVRPSLSLQMLTPPRQRHGGV